ncbi:MAG TPA: hypothetical protein VIR57_12005 [Chloroflexota bacterium]
MPFQVALTIMATIRRDEQASLLSLLERMGQDPAGNKVIPFGAFPWLHFARLVVLDESVDPIGGKASPPYLMFLSDVDNPVDGYLEQVVDEAPSGVDLVWSHCEGYPPAGDRSRASRLAYLRCRMTSSDAVYINTVGRSAQQVLQEAWLRDEIEDFLDGAWPDLSTRPAGEVRAAIQRFVKEDDSLRWALNPAASPGLVWKAGETLHMAGVALLLLFMLPFGIFFLPFWLILLRLHEMSDKLSQDKPDPARVKALAAAEDHQVQNQFTAIGYFKPGWFRRFTAIVALWMVNNAARHYFNNGQLTGVTTIHFARWIPLDSRRRLLFASNYDGSLESYMDDFIDKVAWGLNAVFSNGIGYPRTNWLVLDGARDELAFKNFLRLRQIPTQVWYSAYGNLTAMNIQNNAKLRAGLSGHMSPTDVEQWLACL